MGTPVRESCPMLWRYGRRSSTIRPCARAALADGLARLEPVQAVEWRTAVGDDAGLVHDRRHRQAVPATDLEVVRVVRRGDLECARAECRVDVVVGDHRDVPAVIGMRMVRPTRWR